MDANQLQTFLANLAQLPPPHLEKIIYSLVYGSVDRVSPKEALGFLFRMDETLYRLHGEVAIKYGGGVHPKHRLTNYHDFFVARIGGARRVLDIGCGHGDLALAVAQQTDAEAVFGIDMGKVNIKIAQKKNHHPKVTYEIGDALTHFTDQTFDLVILSNVLEHLPGRPFFLKRVLGRIQPERILIRVPVIERDWRVPLKKELGIEWRLDPTHETEYTLESFAAEMEEAGLEVTHQEVRWGEIWAETKPKEKGA